MRICCKAHLCAGTAAVEGERVVATEDGNLIAVMLVEELQPLLVGRAIRPIRIRPLLKHAQSERRRSGRSFDLTLKIVTVASMKEPAISVAYGYTAMTGRMTGERYDHDICLVIIEGANALKSEPILALLPVHLPLGFVTPLFGDVAPLSHRDFPGDRGLIFDGVNMDCRHGKVRQASSMVTIKVRQKNVTHLVGGEAKRPYLFESCFRGVETRRSVAPPIGWKAFGIGNIAEAKTSVDQSKTFVGFDHQHVTDEPRSFEETASAVDQ
jgi:hypothetical protein